jgi:hypothetical protein
MNAVDTNVSEEQTERVLVVPTQQCNNGDILLF